MFLYSRSCWLHLYKSWWKLTGWYLLRFFDSVVLLAIYVQVNRVCKFESLVLAQAGLGIPVWDFQLHWCISFLFHWIFNAVGFSFSRDPFSTLASFLSMDYRLMHYPLKAAAIMWVTSTSSVRFPMLFVASSVASSWDELVTSIAYGSRNCLNLVRGRLKCMTVGEISCQQCLGDSRCC